MSGAAIDRDGIADVELGHELRGPALHSPTDTGALNLGFLDQNGLVAHFLAIQNIDGFVRLRVVAKFDVTECR